jgi:hypothetical protein
VGRDCRRVKGEYGTSIVHICIQMEKTRPVETISGVGTGEIKENDGRGEFIFNILICHNVTTMEVIIIKKKTGITP